jgi:small GTP-binding protein
MNVSKEEVYDQEIKLLLLGDQAVGKTSLIVNYIDKAFYQNMIGTAGIDFKKKNIVVNEKKVKVTVFDTAGQERFRNIAKSLYKNADGIIVVYDVTDNKTKESVVDWLKLIKKNTENDVDILIIGNKLDLIEDRKVSSEEGEQIAKQLNYPFLETSAKTGKNVNESFMTIINKILNKTLFRNPKTLETEGNTFRERVVGDQTTKDNGNIKSRCMNENTKIALKTNKKKTTNCCGK